MSVLLYVLPYTNETDQAILLNPGPIHEVFLKTLFLYKKECTTNRRTTLKEYFTRH